MDVMSMFRPAKPAAPAAPASEAKPAEGTSVPAAGDPPKPGANPNALKNNESLNPFDGYQKMFDTASKNSAIQAPTFDVDPKVVAEVASKMSFTKGINPELLTKATSGDASAMIQLIEEVGRNAYRASLEHNTKLTEAHLGQRSAFEASNLQAGVRRQLTSEALVSGDNANLNHPVIRAELNSLANRFAQSPEYADASPTEIANAAKKYLNDLHAAMNPVDPKAMKGKDGQQATQGEVDYLKYLQG